MEKPLKIFGLILLILGIFIIVKTLISARNIFTGRTLPPQVFKIEEGYFNLQKEVQGEEKIVPQITQVLSPSNLNKMLNLLSWTLFSSILIFGGSQISILGIRLLKNK
jgi:hypothetical protein